MRMQITMNQGRIVFSALKHYGKSNFCMWQMWFKKLQPQKTIWRLGLWCGQTFQCPVVPVCVTGTCDSAAAMSGILKGKFEEVDGSIPCFSVQESDDEVFSCDGADSVDSVNPSTCNLFTGEYVKLYFRLYSKLCWTVDSWSFSLYPLPYICSKFFVISDLFVKRAIIWFIKSQQHSSVPLYGVSLTGRNESN